MDGVIIKEYFEQENGVDKIKVGNDGSKYKTLVKHCKNEKGIKYIINEYICIDTEEEIYARELKQIDKFREQFNKYSYLVLLHIKDYNELKNSTKTIPEIDIKLNGNYSKESNDYKTKIENICGIESSDSEISSSNIIPEGNIFKNETLNNTDTIRKGINTENKFISESNKDIKNGNVYDSDSESKLPDSDIEGNISGSESEIDITKSNDFLVEKKNLKNSISDDKSSSSIEENKPEVNKIKIKESKKILNKVFKDYYKYYNRLLPEINNDIGINFKNINNNIVNEHINNINNIIQYYEIFKKFKLTNNDITSKSFYIYIEYNKNNYCHNYYNHKQFYDKVKRCYEFIDFLENKNLKHEDIIDLLYKSNLTYTKLFKIRGTDYEDLKCFFLGKLSLMQKINNEPVINEITLKHNNNKETLLNYYGSKHNYNDIINNHIGLKGENKIFDLFSGSCSISYNLNKFYPKNKIIINDNNRLLNIFYKVIKNNEIELLNAIEELNTIENIKNYKFLKNKLNNEKLPEIECAAIYYFLNKIAYNGNMYFDKNNKLYMSCKKDKSKLILDKNKFSDFSKFLKDIEIHNLDLLSCTDFWLSRINKDDLVILDPPYDFFNNGYKNYGSTFVKKHQEELYIFIDKIIKKGAKIITFNSNTPFIRNLYKNFNIDIIHSYCRPSHSTKTELLMYI